MCGLNTTTTLLTMVMDDVMPYISDGASTTGEYFNSLVASSLVRVLLVSVVLPACLAMLSWLLWDTYYASFRSNASLLPLPPGSMGLPLIGETLAFCLMGVKFYRKRRKLYGNVFKTHLLGAPIVRVMGAHNVRKVLLGENSLVTSFWPASVRIMLGSNTITITTGDKHRFLRKGVAKAFSRAALASYVPIMQQMVRDAIRRWCDAPYVRGYQESRVLAFQVACRSLVGFSAQTASCEIERFMEAFEIWVNNLFCLPINVPGCGLSRGLRARKVLTDKIEECIRARERERDADEGVTSSEGDDALSLMMRLGAGEEKLSLEELKEVCLELLFAGHATNASASTSLLYFLGRNPRVVQRVQQELEEHGLQHSQDGDLTFEALSRLTYTGHVIKEVLRLAPPVGGGFRKALKTFEVDGYQVPQGWLVAYSIRETQAFSELFTEADVFRPERWEEPPAETTSNTNTATTTPSNSTSTSAPTTATTTTTNTTNTTIKDAEDMCHFLPFGRGVRSCPGREYARLLLKTLAVEMCRGTHWTLLNEGVLFETMPVPHPADGLPMRVTLQSPV